MCETWLVPEVPSSSVAVDGFRVVRGDGSDAIRKHGCCLYVSESLSFVPIEIDLPNIADVLLVNLNVWVLVVYSPPSYTVEQDDRLIRFLNEFIVGKEVIIVGDFNLPSLDWCSDNVLHGYVPPREMLFFDCFCTLELSQWVEEGTFVDSDNILDLVLTTQRNRVGDVSVLAPFHRCHHCLVVFEYVLQLDKAVDSVNS